jgi:hypothetical protein
MFNRRGRISGLLPSMIDPLKSEGRRQLHQEATKGRARRPGVAGSNGGLDPGRRVGRPELQHDGCEERFFSGACWIVEVFSGGRR